MRWHEVAVHDRVSPFVEGHQLGQELGAVAVGLAGDRVHGDHGAHDCPIIVAALAGARTEGSPRNWQGLPAAWAAASAAKTANALRTMRATPSGWRHAPRPSTDATRDSRRRTAS